ncbi:MAG: SET domain-containing protein [Rhodanobacteraceae bacterium]
MILPSYHIGPSRIPGAGKGLFLAEPLARGRLIIAPDAIANVYRFDEVLAMPAVENVLGATVRWFEDRYTVTPDWPDECYVNHAFSPTGLWHLGFIFASDDIEADTEITVDYRHLLAPGQEETFVDAESGERIIGYTWQQSLTASSRALVALLA